MIVIEKAEPPTASMSPIIFLRIFHKSGLMIMKIIRVILTVVNENVNNQDTHTAALVFVFLHLGNNINNPINMNRITNKNREIEEPK